MNRRQGNENAQKNHPDNHLGNLVLVEKAVLRLLVQAGQGGLSCGQCVFFRHRSILILFYRAICSCNVQLNQYKEISYRWRRLGTIILCRAIFSGWKGKMHTASLKIRWKVSALVLVQCVCLRLEKIVVRLMSPKLPA